VLGRRGANKNVNAAEWDIGYWQMGPSMIEYHTTSCLLHPTSSCFVWHKKRLKKAGALFADFQNFGLQKRMALPTILLGEKSPPVHVTGVAFK